MNQPFSIRTLMNSFKYAFQGLKQVVRGEQNFTMHLLAATCAILLALVFKISTLEWGLLIICIVAVMGMEIMNTAVEKLCNVVSPERQDAIKIIKDLAAAAVLIMALGALIVGGLIFIPRIWSICQIG